MRHPLAVAVVAAALLLSLSACGEGSEAEGINMRPGENCLSCHTGGEPGRFTAAGTVFSSRAGGAGVAGVTVTLKSGATTLDQTITSSAGNFRFTATLPGSFDVVLSKGGATRQMSGAGGACNGCHAQGSGTGRIPAP